MVGLARMHDIFVCQRPKIEVKALLESQDDMPFLKVQPLKIYFVALLSLKP